MEDTNQTLGSIVNTHGLVDKRLERAVLDPLLDVLLVVSSVLVTHTLVSDNESAHIQTLDQHVVEVLDGVGVRVVLGDQTADHNAAEVVQGIQRGLEVLTTDVLVVDVDTVGGQAGQGIGGLLVLVVESRVEAQIFDDVVQLVIRADTADDLEALVLGNLANELTDSTTGRGNKDGLTLLGLADLVERRVGRETGHTQGTEEDTDIFNSQGVLNTANSANLLTVQSNILLDGDEANDQVALLVAGVVGADDLGNGAAVEGLSEVEGGSVGLDISRAHTAAHVGVIAGVDGLHDDAVVGGGHVGVIGGGLNGNVLAGGGITLGDLLEDESLVGSHGGDI